MKYKLPRPLIQCGCFRLQILPLFPLPSPAGTGTLFPCPQCGKQLTSKWGLQTHLDWHRGVFRYHCPVCNKGFMSKGRYKGHVAQHTGGRSFPCPKCEKTFSYVDSMRNHLAKCQNGNRPSTGFTQTTWTMAESFDKANGATKS